MEKEKILQRYRQEGVDEGREEVNRRGDDAGFYAMCVLALLLMIYQAFTGQVFGDGGGDAVRVLLRGGLCPVPDVTGTGPLWAWAFLPALCAWDAWDGICGTRCKKRQAVVFVQRLENGKPVQEGYCLTCARELHIQPVDDLMKRFNMTDDQLASMEEHMADLMQQAQESGAMSAQMDGDIVEPG